MKCRFCDVGMWQGVTYNYCAVCHTCYDCVTGNIKIEKDERAKFWPDVPEGCLAVREKLTEEIK